MTIFYDHQTFSLQNFGGISRYIVELIKGINKVSDHKAFLSLAISNNIHLREAELSVNSFASQLKFLQKQSLVYRINQQMCKFDLSTKKYDIIHATYFDPYFLPYLKGKPFVITFHDMIFEKLGSQFRELGSGTILIRQKKELAEKANRIIAVSESTKKDIVKLLNIDPAKIDVVYHGSSFTPRIIKKPIKINPYLLFVGNRGHYKNFLGFLQAVATLLSKHNLKLICAGGGPFTIDERSVIQELGISDRVKQQYIKSDEMLQALYESALAFIFPSLYEGFGIPILEAFACGCPCVLSNTSSLPEIAGEAALYFDPTSHTSIAQVIERIITNPDLRIDLTKKGTNRLSFFSWNQTINRTLDVYSRC